MRTKKREQLLPIRNNTNFHSMKIINLNSVVMEVNSAKLKEIHHSSCELRFLELEAGFKKHEDLLKSIEDHAKQLNEIKSKLVRFIWYNI